MVKSSLRESDTEYEGLSRAQRKTEKSNERRRWFHIGRWEPSLWILRSYSVLFTLWDGKVGLTALQQSRRLTARD